MLKKGWKFAYNTITNERFKIFIYDELPKNCKYGMGKK